MNEFVFIPQPGARYRYDYVEIAKDLNESAKDNDAKHFYNSVAIGVKTDIFFLLYFVLNRTLVNRPWLVERCYEVQDNNERSAFFWPRFHWKAVDVNEPVPTPGGFKAHGELRVGDSVFGSDGRPCRVIATHPVATDADCYRVTFDKGYSVIVSGDHKWKVMVSSSKRIFGGREKVREMVLDTRELSAEVCRSSEHKTRVNPYVEVSPAVEYDEKNLPIHPYVLGVWLGDGTSSCSNITNALSDNAIIEKIQSLGYSVKRQSYGGGLIVTVSGLITLLKQVGVAGNKHIPTQYLEGSVEQRTDLLRGLMDTDGCCDTRGTATFCNTNLRLAEDVFVLAASLGLKPSFRKHYCEFNGKTIDVYNVSFQNRNGWIQPFGLKRKAERRIGERSSRCTKHRVVSVERVKSIPVSCISVDSEDGCYLIGKHFICTHNSSVAQALRIQDIMKNPDERIGIFSFKRAISQAFLRELMQIFETNELLKGAFGKDHLGDSFILYDNPKARSPKWSEESGIIVHRRSTAKESTVEAWGLVDNLPTSKHYTIQDYDDIVNDETVSSPEQVKKAQEFFNSSLLLMDESHVRRRVWGTFYGFGDPNHALSKNESWYRSIHSWKKNDEYVLLTDESAEQLTADLTDWQVSCQLDMNPVSTSEKKFDLMWIEHHSGRVESRVNRYVLVDPARTKGLKSDYFVAWVVDLDNQRNYLWRDMIRDKLSLSERWEALKKIHDKWDNIKCVFYAKTAAEQDIEYFEEKKREQGVIMRIVPIKETKNKNAEIEKLQPLYKEKRMWLPREIWYDDLKGERHNLVDEFVNQEYLAFPRLTHDDMFNCQAFIVNPDVLHNEVMRMTFPANPAAKTKKRRPLFDDYEASGQYAYMGQ